MQKGVHAIVRRVIRCAGSQY